MSVFVELKYVKLTLESKFQSKFKKAFPYSFKDFIVQLY